MHDECYDFVRRLKTALPSFFEDRAVVEIGARDVNGTVRPLFTRCRYVGVDLVEGEGVDVVASGARTPFADGEFDVGLCLEVFEHTAEWRKILIELKRIVRAQGLVVVTCAAPGRHAHGIDEWGFGHYENVHPAELRANGVGEVVMWSEDAIACDVGAVWRVVAGRAPATASGGLRRRPPISFAKRRR